MCLLARHGLVLTDITAEVVGLLLLHNNVTSLHLNTKKAHQGLKPTAIQCCGAVEQMQCCCDPDPAEFEHFSEANIL